MPVRHCVMIPFLNRHEQVIGCVNALLKQALPETMILLVDDGSAPAPGVPWHSMLQNQNVFLIEHRENYGVASARNSGIDWCRQKAIDILVMMDSDCRPENNMIAEHLRLHDAHPEAVVIGGRIAGEGKGFWAKLDGMTSWVHASPHGTGEASQQEFRTVEHPYHLATTNFSVKLKQLPERTFIFDERLSTGEDCLLIRELRKRQKGIYFSATPKIFHRDRETFLDVFRHHYAWGHHQYFIQLGGDISPRCFNPLYRIVFVGLFLPLIPLFALAGSVLNSKAIWVRQREDLWFYPFIYLLWLGKGCAVIEAAIRPRACLRSGRSSMEYREITRDA
jgi:glycosyltransferase involved in cell wall biosynthesis